MYSTGIALYPNLAPRTAPAGAPLVSASPPSFTIATYHDHRMAMAFAPCALRLGEIIIEDPDVVSKSYPTYWDDLTKLGFTLCHI